MSAGAFATPRSLDGHLIFRGGALRRDDGDGGGEEAGGAEGVADASHCYLAMPPTPGTFVLFPGSMPHLVLARLGGGGAPAPAAEAGTADGDREPAALPVRVSVAINYVDATPPPPA